MDKLLFTFKMYATQEDPKSNILCVTKIGTPDNRTFIIPQVELHHHTELAKTSAVARIKNTLTKRHQTRSIWITLTKALRDTYLDADDNLQFGDVYLEELIIEEESAGAVATGDSLETLLKKFINKSQNSDEKNAGKIAKDFIIEKFNGKNSNSGQWLAKFESECERFNISKDSKKIEILKNFMEKGAIDWYDCTILKLTIDAQWEDWKKNFCDTFSSKGWSPIRYAFYFKYQSGSLLEYAIKKEKLLLEINKSIDKNTLIALIVIGIPNFVSDRIDKEKLKKTEDLYSELSKLEHLTYKKNVDTKTNRSFTYKEKINKKPCEICKTKGSGIRFHPESECWFKNVNPKNVYNTSTLEVDLSDNDPKN